MVIAYDRKTQKEVLRAQNRDTAIDKLGMRAFDCSVYIKEFSKSKGSGKTISEIAPYFGGENFKIKIGRRIYDIVSVESEDDLFVVHIDSPDEPKAQHENVVLMLGENRIIGGNQKQERI